MYWLSIAIQQITLKLNSWKNRFFFYSHSYCWSGIHRQLTCLVLAHVLSWGCSQDAVISRLSWGTIHFEVHSYCCWEDAAPCGLSDWGLAAVWRPPSVPWHMASLVWQFTALVWLAHKGSGERVSARWINIWLLISEVTSHHFCYIVSLRSKSLGPALTTCLSIPEGALGSMSEALKQM